MSELPEDFRSFLRRWDEGQRDYIVDRDLTGPPKPVPSTGTRVTATGAVVADSATIAVPPATPIPVRIPGILEPVTDSRNVMTPRWWRFFEELYRRTGAIEDNVNNASRTLAGSATTAALALTGAAPSAEITHIRQVGTASLTATGIAPSIGNHIDVPTGSIGLTGAAPTIP